MQRLTYGQRALREIACLIVGHKWHSSWRRRKNADELAAIPPDQMTYAQRHDENGNFLYEYGSWWHYKCRRCRARTRQGAHQPLGWRLVVGIGTAVTRAWWHLSYPFKYETSRKERQVLIAFPAALATSWMQFWLVFLKDYRPSFIWTWAADAEYKLYVWAEKK